MAPAAPSAADSLRTTLPLLLLVVLFGAGTSVQVTVNARVGVRGKIPSFAAVLNLSMGLALLTLLHGLEVLHSRHTPEPLAFLAWKTRPTALNLSPGLCGLAYVLSSIFLQPSLGSALFMICIVTGQLASAAALDHVTASARFSAQRGAALALAVVGAIATAADRLKAASGPATIAGSAIATVGTGALMVVQAHLSRGAAAILPSRLASAWWSFFVSAAASWLVFACQAAASSRAARQHWADPQTWSTAPWYTWTAAFYGVAYIASSIIVPRHTGSGAYFVALVCGQLLFAAAIDTAGFFDTPRHALTPVRVVGLLLVVFAAAATQLPPRALCCGRPAKGSASRAAMAEVEEGLLEEEGLEWEEAAAEAGKEEAS